MRAISGPGDGGLPLAKDRCCTGEVCLIQALVTFSCCLVPCSPVMKPTKIESVRLSLTRQHFIMFPVGSRTGQGEQRPLELRLLPATSSASQPADGAETAKGRGGRGGGGCVVAACFQAKHATGVLTRRAGTSMCAVRCSWGTAHMKTGGLLCRVGGTAHRSCRCDHYSIYVFLCITNALPLSVLAALLFAAVY